MSVISLEKTSNLNSRNPDFQNLEIRSFDKKYSNEKQKIDRFKKTSEFITSSYGSKKLFRAFYLSCKWPVNFETFLKLNPAKVKKIVYAKKQFKNIAQSLDVTKIFSTIKNVKQISINIQRKDSEKVFKIAIKIVQIILDILSFIGLGQLFYFYSLGEAESALKFSKRLFKVISGSFLLYNDRTKYVKHLKTQKVFESQKSITPRLKVIFSEIKNLDLLKIIKNIALIALNVFIVFDMIFQVALISATLKIALSTISLCFAISAHFYKETLTYSKIAK